MSSIDSEEKPRYTRYNRWNPDGVARPTRGAHREEPPKPTILQWLLEHTLFAVFIVAFLLGLIALYSFYSPSHKEVPNFVDAGMRQDRVNILFIGVGGEAHPGGGKELADSIIFVSLKPSTRQAAVMSIPRDLWVRVGRYGMHRINRAHEIGAESGYPGGGPGLLANTISGVLNQPIHAFVRVDFVAFEKVIDALGGIDVYVPRGFYDYLFRDGFTLGWHHMDGKRALAYARYRYIIGPEGDNFARELRQQQVIDAVRAKVSGANPKQIAGLIQALSTLSRETDTNLTTAQMLALYRRFRDLDSEEVRHVSLKPLTEIFQVTRLTDPGDAVRPVRGNYLLFQAIARNVFSSTRDVVAKDQLEVVAAPAPAARREVPHARP